MRRQNGTLALEFAPLFIIFFGLFYAIVSYSLAMLLQLSLTHAASEGARAAVKLADPLSVSSVTAYNALTREVVRARVLDTLSWMSPSLLAHIDTATGIMVTSTPQGSLSVTVKYANYAGAPLVPALTLPGLGTIPALPTDLLGRAVVQP
jgi:Flp pilus assembly protein TadG